MSKKENELKRYKKEQNVSMCIKKCMYYIFKW